MENQNDKFKGRLTKVKVTVLIQAVIAAMVYSPRGIQALADSISGFGGMVRAPKVSRPDAEGRYRVFDGWRRVLAAILLGWEYIFVEVMENLPEEDEPLFIVECNNYREKTALEKFHEIKIYEVELPKRQGTRTDLEGEEQYNQREAIAKKMDVAESEVRDLKTVGEAPNGEELLSSIDGKTVTLTALARKVRQTPVIPDYSGYIACEPVDLEPCACPLCNNHPTKRIEVINRELFYVN